MSGAAGGGGNSMSGHGYLSTSGAVSRPQSALLPPGSAGPGTAGGAGAQPPFLGGNRRTSLTILAALAAASLPTDLPAQALLDNNSSTVSISSDDGNDDDGLPSPSELTGRVSGSGAAAAGAAGMPAPPGAARGGSGAYGQAAAAAARAQPKLRSQSLVPDPAGGPAGGPAAGQQSSYADMLESTFSRALAEQQVLRQQQQMQQQQPVLLQPTVPPGTNVSASAGAGAAAAGVRAGTGPGPGDEPATSFTPTTARFAADSPTMASAAAAAPAAAVAMGRGSSTTDGTASPTSSLSPMVVTLMADPLLPAAGTAPDTAGNAQRVGQPQLQQQEEAQAHEHLAAPQPRLPPTPFSPFASPFGPVAAGPAYRARSPGAAVAEAPDPEILDPGVTLDPLMDSGIGPGSRLVPELKGADLQYVKSLVDRKWSPFFELSAALGPPLLAPVPHPSPHKGPIRPGSGSAGMALFAGGGAGSGAPSGTGSGALYCSPGLMPTSAAAVPASTNGGGGLVNVFGGAWSGALPSDRSSQPHPGLSDEDLWAVHGGSGGYGGGDEAFEVPPADGPSMQPITPPFPASGAAFRLLIATLTGSNAPSPRGSLPQAPHFDEGASGNRAFILLCIEQLGGYPL
eukprot:XP_001702761.1 predicted protein [Chlamydomonas reinhardtii]